MPLLLAAICAFSLVATGFMRRPAPGFQVQSAQSSLLSESTLRTVQFGADQFEQLQQLSQWSELLKLHQLKELYLVQQSSAEGLKTHVLQHDFDTYLPEEELENRAFASPPPGLHKAQAELPQSIALDGATLSFSSTHVATDPQSSCATGLSVDAHGIARVMLGSRRNLLPQSSWTQQHEPEFDAQKQLRPSPTDDCTDHFSVAAQLSRHLPRQGYIQDVQHQHTLHSSHTSLATSHTAASPQFQHSQSTPKPLTSHSQGSHTQHLISVPPFHSVSLPSNAVPQPARSMQPPRSKALPRSNVKSPGSHQKQKHAVTDASLTKVDAEVSPTITHPDEDGISLAERVRRALTSADGTHPRVTIQLVGPSITEDEALEVTHGEVILEGKLTSLSPKASWLKLTLPGLRVTGPEASLSLEKVHLVALEENRVQGGRLHCTDCYICSRRGCGILCLQKAKVSLTDCQVSNCMRSGIGVNGKNTEIDLTRCSLTQNNFSGLGVNHQARSITLQDCRISGNSYHGVWLNAGVVARWLGDGGCLDGNRLEAKAGAGILIGYSESSG